MNKEKWCAYQKFRVVKKINSVFVGSGDEFKVMKMLFSLKLNASWNIMHHGWMHLFSFAREVFPNQTSINETTVVGRNDLMILTFKPHWLTLTDRGYFISPKKISAFRSGWDCECIFFLKTRFSTENRITLAQRKARIKFFLPCKFSPLTNLN